MSLLEKIALSVALVAALLPVVLVDLPVVDPPAALAVLPLAVLRWVLAVLLLAALPWVRVVPRWAVPLLVVPR